MEEKQLPITEQYSGYWILSEDSTVQGEDENSLGVEFRSPVFYDNGIHGAESQPWEDDIHRLIRALDKITSMSLTINSTAGLHVHVSKEGGFQCRQDPVSSADKDIEKNLNDLKKIAIICYLCGGAYDLHGTDSARHSHDIIHGQKRYSLISWSVNHMRNLTATCCAPLAQILSLKGSIIEQ